MVLPNLVAQWLINEQAELLQDTVILHSVTVSILYYFTVLSATIILGLKLFFSLLINVLIVLYLLPGGSSSESGQGEMEP